MVGFGSSPQGVDRRIPVQPGADLCLESEHGCEHICESSPGSFHCLCLPGYTLNPDGKTCAGEWLVVAMVSDLISSVETNVTATCIEVQIGYLGQKVRTFVMYVK